jgi:hypothetical protein
MFRMGWFVSVHWNGERKAMPRGSGAAVRRDFEKSSRAVELNFAFADSAVRKPLRVLWRHFLACLLV